MKYIALLLFLAFPACSFTVREETTTRWNGPHEVEVNGKTIRCDGDITIINGRIYCRDDWGK